MLNFEEPKQIEHFLSNVEKLYNEDDSFVNDDLKEQILLYKSLEKQEKELNKILTQKRSDFQEALRFIPLSIDTSLKIFIKSQIIQKESHKEVVIDVLGKHVLNQDFNNSFIKEENEIEKLFAFETFPNLIKKIELSSQVEKYFEEPVQIDSKKLTELRKQGQFDKKKGFRISGKIQEIYNCFNSDLKLKIWLKKQATNFKLPQNLENFMKRKIASRREILESVWSHIKNNNLLKKGIVTLDKKLATIFTVSEDQPDINYIPINEIGLQLRNYCIQEEKLEFDIQIGQNESVINCYEILYKQQLDDTRECMAFFAEKMQFDEKNLQQALKKNKSNYNIKFMKNEILLKNKKEQIAKNFNKLQNYLIKRQNYNKFASNMEQFLIDFLNLQNQNLQSIRSHSANFLQKKNYADPNDFMNHLVKNYDDLIEREIKRIIKPSSHNQFIQ